MRSGSMARLGILAFATLSGVGDANADCTTNLAVNGSFESGPAAGQFVTLGTGDTSIVGWTVTGTNIDYVGTYWDHSNGVRSADLNGTSAGGLVQTIPTMPLARYAVTFDMAGNPVGSPTLKTLRVSAAGDSQDFTFDMTGHSRYAPPGMGWVQRSWSFIATGTQTNVEFRSLTTGSYGPALDNVQVCVMITGVEARAWANVKSLFR